MRFQQSVGYLVIILGVGVIMSVWKANEFITTRSDLLKYLVWENSETIGTREDIDAGHTHDEMATFDIADEGDGSKLLFRYEPPPKAKLEGLGKTFKVKVPKDVSQSIADLTNHFVTLTPETLNSFAFAMAASENHVQETKDGIAAIQFHFPDRPIYYYDIGMTNDQIQEVGAMQNVHMRSFNFSRYPAHFQTNLRMCVWKPFIIVDLLKEYGGVFWMDASVRLHTDDFSKVNEMLLQNDGMVLFKSTAHSNFAATHKGAYDYIPTRRQQQQRVYMQCAAAMFVYNTRPLFLHVLWWWFLCAYEERCQVPMPKTACDFADNPERMSTFANCHKWDQSTINILLSNYHGFNVSLYAVPEDWEVVTIERWPTNYYQIQVQKQQ